MGFQLETQSEKGADSPFLVMQGKTLLMADIGEVVHHRQAVEFVGSLTNYSPTAGDDDLGKVVVQGDAGVAEGHRSMAIDNEGGKGRDVQQPTL